ncbi:MAG: hypothetical protein CVU48_05745 [Candidatus Cloacimonetes bacterium HGW-Cloacimonetes-1]|jgi:ABC-type nitrate/sulfonate/bicarbonate transport system substrate-binding protein|nr:MAG: hypothetical protein CVU48_05745 [Candidatus Cloacimonetes bacterium HGW-Cloacimonetes-1]
MSFFSYPLLQRKATACVKLKFIVLITLAFVLLITAACKKKNTDQLRIGIVQPSINHLPFTYTINQNAVDINDYKIIQFTSGWEAQEAIIGKEIDVAILPFTYAWNAAIKGYPVKIVSFLERQSDGIVVGNGIKSIQDLNNKRIGILKASTLDILMQDFAQSRKLQYTPVYFRSPSEQVAALKSSNVDAIVSYVPTIQKFNDDYPVIHWFADDYPMHPCCDLVVNTENLTKQRQKQLFTLFRAMNKQIPKIHTFGDEILQIISKDYKLNIDQASSALEHTGFMMGLEPSGMDFERKMIDIGVANGMFDKFPSDLDIYWNITYKYQD